MAKTNNDVPPYDKMIWPTLKALAQSGGSASNQELRDRVVLLMNLPDSTQAVLHVDGPTTEVDYRLAWARTYLKKVGAVDNSGRAV